MLGFDGAQCIGGGQYEAIGSSFRGLAQMGLDLTESGFDGIEVGRVFGQKVEACLAPGDHGGDGGAFVAAEVIHHDGVTRPEGGSEALFGVGREHLGIDWSVDHHGREDAAPAHGGNQGGGLPSAVRDLGDEPLAASAATMGPRHVGLGPGLVDEDQLVGRQLRLLCAKRLPGPRDVRTVLLGGVQRFF